MDFTITVNDPDLLASITWAREQANIGKPKDDLISIDADFIQSRVLSAVESYAMQKVRVGGMVKVEADVADMAAKIAAARGK